MTINLDFGKYTDYNVSESRISRMLQSDKKSATQISLWEKFKDLFRTDKKNDAYNELYNLLHNTEGGDKLDAFNRLKDLAKPEHQSLFTKEIYCNDVVFLIKNNPVAQSSIQGFMGVSEQTPLHSMSRSEQQVFLDMLDTLREKEVSFSHLLSSQIRKLVSKEHCVDVLSLYRPQENIEFERHNWIVPEIINDKEQRLLCDLSPGAMNPSHMFSFMGYQKTSSGVEFTMMHPSISYFLHTYMKPDADSKLYLDGDYADLLNKSYDKYNANKAEYDKVLSKVYHAHGETLNISYLGVNNNHLVLPPNNELQNHMQSDDFASELLYDLSKVFYKWILSD